MDEGLAPEQRRLPETPWPLVEEAGGPDPLAARGALNLLLRRYLPALQAHLVRVRRLDLHEANDLVQGFVQVKVLGGNLVGTADRSRGRFRTFLLTALDRYVSDQRRRRGARKRRHLHGNSQEPDSGLVAPAPAADAFQLEWARSVIDAALRRMHAECEEKSRPELWGVFEDRILAHTLAGKTPLSYDDLVARYGFRSPSQASNAVITAKRMFARALRTVLAVSAGESEAEIEEELRELLKILETGGA